ncbi:IDEAL domain-containing protein [Aquibacillus sediminis]|uniref:IDEAL domain-containing protein n=1 Tax=Aquibacillus sediminis TaxID=2574734 RepID=UPI0011091B60|nr:IDEAL domain-containing protein [Aquibacillus sediminis]
MKKHKVVYKLQDFGSSRKEAVIYAKKEISFEVKLASKLVLDELCFSWNKARLEQQINESIDNQDKDTFMHLSREYRFYTRE